MEALMDKFAEFISDNEDLHSRECWYWRNNKWIKKIEQEQLWKISYNYYRAIENDAEELGIPVRRIIFAIFKRMWLN